MFSRGRRSVAVSVAAAGALLLVAGCAESEASPSASTVTIQPSSYVVRDPVTTTSEAPPGSVAEGRSPVEQSYTIQSTNDVPFNVAKMYDVDLEDLRNYNGWEAETFAGYPGIGGVVKIPPGAKLIDLSTTTTRPSATTDPDATDATDAPEGTEAAGTAAAAATTTTAADDCAPGRYTIEAGDAPLVVARKFDVTLEALTEANGWTPPGYLDFGLVGQEIIIPPKEGCD